MAVIHPIHHAGALISYSLATFTISFLLTFHIIASYKGTKELKSRIKNKPAPMQRKQLVDHYLIILSSGLSMTCYLIISVSGVMAESHFPHCWCNGLTWIIANMYITGKVLNYYFFLMKAKGAQGMIDVFPSKLCGLRFPSKDRMFNLWFPVLIICTEFVYVFLFNIGPPVFDTWYGTCIYTEKSHIGCQYSVTDDFKLLVSLGPVTDISLSILFTFLFYVPIIRVTKMTLNEFVSKSKIHDPDNQQTKEKFISILKISLTLSLINIFSSTIGLSVAPFYPQFWWVFSFDYMVNAFCTFLAMGNDRRFLIKTFRCEKNIHPHEQQTEQSIQTTAAMQAVEMKQENLMTNEAIVEPTEYETQVVDQGIR